MKVRAGSWYVFNPVGWDRVDPKTFLKAGAKVQVRNLPGCPKANTMGHAHVFDANGKFAGLVCTASLSKPAAGEVA